MPTYPSFPDATAVVSGVIRAALLTGLDKRVYSSIPKSPQYPLATVTRLGGLPAVREYLDMARIDISVWGGAKGDPPGGPSQSTIHDIAQAIRALLMSRAGTTVSTPVAAFISEVEDALGLSFVPDPLTSRDRWLFSVNVYLRSP